MLLKPRTEKGNDWFSATHLFEDLISIGPAIYFSVKLHLLSERFIWCSVPFFVFSYAILNSYADYRCNFGPRLINFGKKTVIWIICGSQEDLEVKRRQYHTSKSRKKRSDVYLYRANVTRPSIHVRNPTDNLINECHQFLSATIFYFRLTVCAITL